LRERISAQSAQIKNVAKQIVDTERAISELPISAQITAHGLASRLRAISENLAGAAHYGAATAHRLAGIANAKVQEIDDAKPLDEQSLDALKGVAALTKMANEASTVGLNLLSANKEAVKQAITPPEDPQSQAPARPKISRDEWLKHHGMAG
jgi:ABC-type transporter Mla subunit MlaD